ncbi:MAG: RloA protein [Osedax symbiont Rs1]|nr:MAG: RloA protein [Osedax symbiont Rs1]
MLIEFTVGNFRSIKEPQTLSLAKAKGSELEQTNCFLPEAPGSIELVRSAAIYGANAAGKSNVIKALDVMDTIVLKSASSQEGDDIPVSPFLFDKLSSEEPSEFEIVFISEGVRYQYGFTATSKKILEEWLIAYPKGRPQKWFNRAFDPKTKSQVFKFGDSLLGQKSVWQQATRSNALLLSTAIQLNSEQLKPVYNWFRNKLRVASSGDWGPSFTASLCQKKDLKNKILSFLKSADFDIHDIQIDKEKFDPDSLPDEIPKEAREKIIKELEGKELLKIKTVHKSSNDDLVSLDFDEESEGTKKFFSFAGPWLDTLKHGYILVIDELHDSLHPNMVKYLVDLFHNKNTNPNNAQLIFTTHETSILNQDVFRRDQIWFCEKDNGQATSLYPLTDFSPRKERENIELGYLSGRYGALPFIKSFSLDEEL